MSYSSSTRWLRKKSAVSFDRFLPKTMASWDCGSYFSFKKFTKVTADQISGASKQSFWNHQSLDHVKKHYNVLLIFSDIARWCITSLCQTAAYICLIFVIGKKTDAQNCCLISAIPNVTIQFWLVSSSVQIKVRYEVKIAWKLGKKYILTSTKEIWNLSCKQA